MKRKSFLKLLAATALAVALPAWADDNVVVIANTGLRGLDAESLKRIWAGRTIALDGTALRPVNLPAGHPVRRRFLATVMQQDDDEYVAYWTVRRYVGKGAPPRELGNSAEVIEFVRSTPGAIGYIDAADVKPGLSVVFRR